MRNQARQKLATLRKTRFQDLASDVFFELGRRYPEFKEAEVKTYYISNQFYLSHSTQIPIMMESPASPGSNDDKVSSPHNSETSQSQPPPPASTYSRPGEG